MKKKLNKHDLIKFTNAGWSIEDLLEYTGMSKKALLAFMKGHDIKVKKAVVPKEDPSQKKANKHAINKPMTGDLRACFILSLILITPFCIVGLIVGWSRFF